MYLTGNPPSLNWDEVSHGYNAYSVLKTGMDEWGEKLPILNFRAYGDYPTSLNLYLTIPFVAALGLNEMSIRAPHAMLGVLTLISVYFLSFGLTKRKDISLLAMFLAAVGSWYIFTSRFVLQSNVSVFLITTSFAFFFNRERRKVFIPLSLIFLFLTLLSYHTTRIFSPLILGGMLFLYKKEIFKSLFAKVFIGLFFVITALIFLNSETWTRGKVLSIVNEGAINSIIDRRQKSDLPPVIERLIFNRPIYFISEFSKNYVSYFSPKFLFFEGGSQYQFSIPRMGLIYLVSMPFFYLGIVYMIKKAKEEKDFRLTLLWLLLYPIPASLTNENFAVVRATTLLPLTEILTALGLYWVLEKLNKKYSTILLLLYLVATLLSLRVFSNNYYGDYKTNYSWSWQYGYKEAVSYATSHYNEYDKIIVTKKYGEPHEFFLFFMSYSPDKYRNDPNLIRFHQSDWYWVDRFDKFYFVNDWQIKELKLESGGEIDCEGVKCLLITSPNNLPLGWSKLETINFLDGKPAFEIYEN